jgi:DNA-binding transcriptional ArsR family regulator
MVESVNNPSRSDDIPDGLFRALADPSRRRMLNLLAEQELPLKGIEERFRMSRPAVIKHLRILKACKLVRVRRQGRLTIHSLNARPLRVVKDWVSRFEALWNERLQNLKQQVEADV